MQIDYPRWPPGTVTKNSINTKMTISQDPLVEIDPALCQNVSCMNLYDQICVRMILAWSCLTKNRPVKFASISKNSKV